MPVSNELNKLNQEYRELYRDECSEFWIIINTKIGELATCGNCANSCIIESDSGHNACLIGKCTCCNDWCFSWTPENDVSKHLRENFHYSDDVGYNLEKLFGSNFLKRCDSPEKSEIVMEALKLMARFDEMWYIKEFSYVRGYYSNICYMEFYGIYNSCIIVPLPRLRRILKST